MFCVGIEGDLKSALVLKFNSDSNGSCLGLKVAQLVDIDKYEFEDAPNVWLCSDVMTKTRNGKDI